MITATCMGGIGNFLFQVAMLYAYSLKHGVEYCIPTENANPHYPDQKPFIFPNLNYCDNPPGLPLYLEKDFTYSELPRMDNVKFQGYWQSERNFLGYRAEILKAFDIPYEFKEDYVAIHTRRGDYLLYPTMHPVLPKEYFLDAIEYFVWLGYKNFIVFGDDPLWNRENIKKDGVNIEYSEGRTELEDLSLASSCQNIIGSNSTFSWWIYYLNQYERRIGYFPTKDKWFGKDLPHNVDDLYFPLPKWILR